MASGAGCTRRQLEPCQTVFRQGDLADAVFYVEQGKIQLRITAPEGAQAVIGTLSRGDFLGQGCLAGQASCLATATATAASSVTRIERGAMLRILRDQPRIAGAFIAFLLSRNIQIEANLVDQMLNAGVPSLAAPQPWSN